MRSIAYVRPSDDNSTARIGGGTLLSQVANELADHSLVTTLGNVGSVGYVGFATIGGYGPLSQKFGLAVDQIVGARIVDAQGRIIECEESHLVGIRGGGPALGIILELTIKVYPLQQASNGHYCLADTASDSI
jgi:FAD/FMN-containing dehydrogenase